MNKEPDAEISFLKGCGPDITKTGSAHLATEQVPAHAALAAEAEEDEDEEGVITLDFSSVSDEQADVLMAAARSSGLRVRPPFSPCRPDTLPEAQGQGTACYTSADP